MNFRKMGLLFCSGLLLSGSILIPSFNFLIWFAFVPLLILVSEINLIQSFWCGTFCSVAFFTSLLFWIVKYEIRILVIVLALTTPFMALFAFLTRWLWNLYRKEIFRTLAVPVAWFLIHFIYSFTIIDIVGNQIAFLQAPNFPGIVRIAGLSGITFLVLLTNSLIAQYLMNRKKVSLVGLVIITLVLAFGLTSKFPFYQTQPLRVALVQHNFLIDPEWRAQNREKIVETYTQAIKQLGKTIDLIAFPQYGLPVDVLREPRVFDDLAKKYKTSIILGTYLPKVPGGSLDSGERTDSALVFSPDRPVQEYQAITAPPFRRIGQVLGSARKTLAIQKIRMGVMLCYEDTRSEEGRLWTLNGAQILISLSNPGHFLETNLPYYHLMHDRIQAIETGKYLIRVSPNGFSALVNPNGELIKQSRLNEESIINGVIYPNHQETLFVKWGDILPKICAMIGMIMLTIPYLLNSINFLARKIR